MRRASVLYGRVFNAAGPSADPAKDSETQRRYLGA